MRRLVFVLAMLCLPLSAGATTWTADRAIFFVMDNFESSSYVPDDCGRGASRYGITQETAPGEDIEHLTRKRAYQIYKTRFWFPSGAEYMPNELKIIVYDTAVNFGVGRMKVMLAQAHYEPWALLKLRVQWHLALLKRSPVYRAYAKTWASRDQRIADLIPSPTEIATN